MSDEFDITVPDGEPIPTVPEMVAHELDRLNAKANPIGHTVEYDGEFYRVRPTGSDPGHSCLCVELEAERVEDYLKSRGERSEWHLDMEDSSIRVEPVHPGINTSVRLVDASSDETLAVLDAGVTGDSHTGLVSSVYVVADVPPAVGRWYR
ncbi:MULTISPECIES: hypothetical protein [unclassified Gordonia (in: high G+C Gram-positive bacteria)]|uniref:hypothetical protein n=1 Tax=unclassified Gordonia (in: high G+C Gram-positive bacteria) TaxID=2657482 RepID=UPI0007EB2CE7|nr:MULTISPECIES: hypothetical protein [unclassified Gordonia (in: high G+C Gram-positive bacteria)]OBC07758.1 hypothetical protein A5785_00730 [Gordonia sp. 852002-50395_SCH5434458]OBC10350.1 hypothetical protein A5786_05300 [Gordonia sp. 852002-50816_SCH5313054-a]OBC20317.1 hypothetical protein A5788_06610 [Gordonia sp. 852002-50816_SCH5313054-c]SKZ46365.1 Uncharacterised protein [Mycobacteroides abscessus subsp. abscessus]